MWGYETGDPEVQVGSLSQAEVTAHGGSVGKTENRVRVMIASNKANNYTYTSSNTCCANTCQAILREDLALNEWRTGV